MTATPEPGIYFDVPFAEYRNWDAINNGSLSAMGKSAEHYRHEQTHGREDTPALRTGRLIHCKQLTPDLFNQEYAVIPAEEIEAAVIAASDKQIKNVRATKSYKDRVAQFQKENSGKEIASQDDLKLANSIDAAIQKSELAAQMLTGSAEVSIIWDDTQTELRCKARADIWNQGQGYLSDLKTTRDASRFEISMANFNYDRQAAFYLDGFNTLGAKCDAFNFVAVETIAPFGVRAAPTQLVTLATGRAKYRKALEQIRECRKAKVWPGYESPKYWELPAWAITEETR